MSENLDLGIMNVPHRDAIHNVDIITLVSVLDVGLRQFSASPSSTRNDIMAGDVDIMKGLADSFRREFELAAGQPETYLPAKTPKKTVPNPPEVNVVQNPQIQHQCLQMAEMRGQLLGSESCERKGSFHSIEVGVVFVPWLAKFEAYNRMCEDKVDPANAASTWFPASNTQDRDINARGDGGE